MMSMMIKIFVIKHQCVQIQYFFKKMTYHLWEDYVLVKADFLQLKRVVELKEKKHHLVTSKLNCKACDGYNYIKL